MTPVCGTLFPLLLRATDDLPARDHCLEMFDAGNAEFFFRDCMPDASESIHIVLGVSTLVRLRLVRNDQPFALIHPERMHGNAQYSRG